MQRIAFGGSAVGRQSTPDNIRSRRMRGRSVSRTSLLTRSLPMDVASFTSLAVLPSVALCVLCASVSLTTETQRTQRLHREDQSGLLEQVLQPIDQSAQT